MCDANLATIQPHRVTSSPFAALDTAWEAGSDGHADASAARHRYAAADRSNHGVAGRRHHHLGGRRNRGAPLFREHLHQAGVAAGSAEEFHADEAYQYATALSVGGAVAVSALVAFAVSWYVSRRLQRSITEVASAATAVAEGRYGIRVSPPHLGEDFDSLAQAFNQMAAQLQAVDTSRRQLFADLAHEIRTPVSVLQAYTEAIEDGVRSLTPDTTAMLRDQTQRLVRFAEDVAALAQAEESATSLEFADIDVAELIAKTAAALSGRYRAKAVSLSTHLPTTELPPLWGDEQRLSQVLANLLDNALRHTPPHGRVDVHADTDGTRLLLRVTDTGEGIAAEHLSHVFERLYRADAARTRDHGAPGSAWPSPRRSLRHTAATSAPQVGVRGPGQRSPSRFRCNATWPQRTPARLSGHSERSSIQKWWADGVLTPAAAPPRWRGQASRGLPD